jgi:hypothetical protein
MVVDPINFKPGSRLPGQVAVAVTHRNCLGTFQFVNLLQMGIGDLSAAHEGNS